MLSVKWMLICFLWLGATSDIGHAGTYVLTSGESVSGDPISYNETGVILKSSDGSLQPRVAWNRFTQPALKQLAADGRSPQNIAFVEPFLEEVAQAKAQRNKIEIKPVQRIDRPTGRTGLLALFSSPLGLLILAILYAANIFAGFEIAYFRNQPYAIVCAVAAAAPLVGPLVFLCLPTQASTKAREAAAAEDRAKETPAEPEMAGYAAPIHPSLQANAAGATEATSAGLAASAVESVPAPPAAPLSPTVTFKKGEFTFNRRFFETKMPGFFRVVPSEADRDKVLFIRAQRGEFIGRRITNINQSELYLQVFKDNVTADEMIPFNEVSEVQIRHKDAV